MKIEKNCFICPFIENKNNLMEKIRFKYKNKNKNNFNSPIYLLIFLLVFINLISISITKPKERLLNFYSEITMTITGNGQQEILSSNYAGELPDIIYVNNIYNNEKSRIVNDLNNIKNSIKMIWNSSVTTCNNMFSHLSNIIEIDFSYFNTTLIADMASMLYECYSLTSINFNNIDTSKVTNMNSMFYKCSSLTE